MAKCPKPGDVLLPDEFIVSYQVGEVFDSAGFMFVARYHVINGPVSVVSMLDDGVTAFIVSDTYVGNAHVLRVVKHRDYSDFQILLIAQASMLVMLAAVAILIAYLV